MRTLILSPHLDDEVLGCASFLNTAPLLVLYTTTAHPLAPEVKVENDLLAQRLHLVRSWTSIDRINELDNEPQHLLIRDFEKVINEWHPDVVLVPAPSYNQDHRACYEAMLTACRPHDRNFFVKRVLVYEEPETLGAMRSAHVFHPQYFRPLDLSFKLACYEIYQSQVRAHRSEAHIAAMATVRGAQAGIPYAEAFEVARWVE